MPEYIVDVSSIDDFGGFYRVSTKPVVRCKDCRFMEEHENEFALCIMHRMTTWYGGFCSCGERRDDE